MTGNQGLEAELTAALADRAEAVAPGPMPAARAAVDRRLKYRRRRRVGVTGVAVVLGLGFGVVAGAGRETGPPDVVSGDRVAGAADVDPGDDPATVGLPRVALDAEAVGRPRIEDDPLVQAGAAPTDPGAGAGLELVQVFRPADALLPAVFATSGPDGLDLPVAGSTEEVEVGDARGTWTGRQRGWSRLTWTLPGGRSVQLHAYGVDRGELLAVAVGLEPRPSGPGFDAGDLPPGFVARDVTPDPDGTPAGAPCYRYRYDGAPEVAVTVWAEGDFDREVALLHVLAGARVAEAVEVDGRPGLLAQHPDGSWSVGWSPADGVTGAVGVHGPDAGGAAGREVAAAVRTVDAEVWAGLVDEGRRP